MSYTKLFSSIVTSTIWSESDRTRIVWITMLAICDKNGEVQGSIPGLARIAGVPVDDCRAAIATFLSPDPDSRTKDDEGRRIDEIDGGWILLNYAKYREMASHEDRKRSAAERQSRARDRKKRNAESRPSHAPVTPESLQICQAEAEAEAEAEKKNTLPQTPSAAAKVKAPRKPRERNPLFDELAKLDGWSESNPLTGTAGGRVGSALSDIRTACPHVTTEEIGRRARNYQARYPDAAITSTALASNWALCDTGAQPAKKKYDDRPL